MPSAAGPAAALGLKTQSALMSGDMDLATTTAAGAAQNAAAQAQSLAAAAAATAAPAGALPAAARSGAYRWGAMDIASHSLPAVPARSSSAGRPARPVAAILRRSLKLQRQPPPELLLPLVSTRAISVACDR